ncbi:Abnormal spindle-like microcephaly-associated protein [Schistosoma japonicum]|uniref:Abnormal spindle-like microcephaly-associated protein n=1 Tax=Schistosoma japonicum TaxID=6182 RepID=A0A4Z2D3Q7_SCHJA|nr:Abnormal spindle-like microcephaly-associated protein [Schistosoma japonicum]
MSSSRSNRSTPTSTMLTTTTTTSVTKPTYPYQQSNLLDKESLAATKIQAGYRGYCTRKKYGNLTLNSSSRSTSSPSSNRGLYASHQSPLRNDYNDLENAATRIQASYRGYLTRKALRDDNIHKYTPVKNISYDNQGEKKLNHYNICDSIDYIDDGKVKAVTKIQAGYRGYKTRKSLAPILQHHQHDTRQNLISNKENQNLLTTATTHSGYKSSTKSHDNAYSLYDPELAATKIQATYRGYRTRRHLSK